VIKNFLFFKVLYAISFSSFSQEIKPAGNFLQDSAKIGEEIAFAFQVKYPRGMEVLFPDSTYNFSPFEFVRKNFYTTRSDSVSSTDSAVYYLSTFEIEKVQHLSLPVFVIRDSDSIAIQGQKDSIFLKELITTLPDTLDLKANTEYNEVPMDFNYPYFLIGIGILIVLGAILILVFGKAIKRKYRIYRMKKRHKKFNEKFTRLVDDLTNENSSKAIEETLTFWKKYMENLERLPYTKLTTKEIVVKENGSNLKKPLGNLDRTIYGSAEPSNIDEDFEQLHDFAEERYQKKIQHLSYD